MVDHSEIMALRTRLTDAESGVLLFGVTPPRLSATPERIQWLGVEVPRWLENSLLHADDTLAESYEHCLANARDLIAFCRGLGMPFGFLVESVSIRKVEIEASVALAHEVSGLLGREAR